MKLTAANVEKIHPSEKRQEIRDSLCPGLILLVQTTGKKSWQVRYRMAGVQRRMILGPYPLISLADARDRARAAMLDVTGGGDPVAQAKTAKTQPVEVVAERDTVAAVIDLFMKRHAVRNRRAKDVQAIFTREVLPKWGERDIQTITKRDAVELIDAVVDRGAPIAANRLLAHLRTLWTWAKGRDIIAASPFEGIKPPAKERARDRVLTDQEIAWLWKACDKLSQPFGPLYRFLLLTGQRLREAAEMTEGEVTGNLWVIPSARVKNEDAHAVPLSAPALGILQGVTRIEGKTGLIFTTTGASPVSGYSRAKRRLDELMQATANKGRPEGAEPITIPPFTIHDLRRTAASGMASLRIAPHVVEAVLNHRSGTRKGVAGIYNRFDYADEKRAALEAWARHVEALAGREVANVVSFRAGR